MNYSFKIVLAILVLLTTLIGAERETHIKELFAIATIGDARLSQQSQQAKIKLSSYGGEAAKFLVTQLRRINPLKFETAKEVLTMIGDDALPYLVAALSDTSPKVSSAAAEILGAIKSKKAVSPLKIAALHGDVNLKSAACWALGEIGDTSAVDVLTQALFDTSALVRRAAAYALGQLGCCKNINALLGLLSDGHYSVRYAAFDALRRMCTPKLKEKVKLRLKNANPPERDFLIVLLGCFGDEVENDLASFVQSTNYFERGFACEALGNVRGNYKVANILKKALWDSSPFVRMKALRALENLKKPHNLR